MDPVTMLRLQGAFVAVLLCAALALAYAQQDAAIPLGAVGAFGLVALIRRWDLNVPDGTD